MKRILLCLIGMFVSVGVYSQSWTYNFDNATTAGHTSGISTTFLPAPSVDGGTARVRIGTGGGAFNVLDNFSGFSTSKVLEGVAPTTASVNKFSIYEYLGSNVFKISFKVRFTGGALGAWYFFQGNGSTFSDNSGLNGAHVFSGLRFTYGADGVITTYRRLGNSWIQIASITSQDVDYNIEIYGNNSSSNAVYTKDSPQSVASNTWDLWVNGSLVGEGDFGKSANSSGVELAAGSVINSFMFYGESSTGNVAKIYLDDIAYTITEPIAETQPVSITTFTAKPINKSILLNWQTVSERNNKHFEIERSADGEIFASVATINGAGTSNEVKNYSYTDYTPFAGVNYYRLLQQDFDGTTTIVKTIAVNPQLDVNQLSVYTTASTVNVDLYTVKAGQATVAVYDFGGRKLAEQPVSLALGTNTVVLEADLLPGLYFVKVLADNEVSTVKFAK